MRTRILTRLLLAAVTLILSLACGRSAPQAEGSTSQTLKARLRALGVAPGSPVYLRIFKEEVELEVWMPTEAAWVQVGTWPVCRYSGELGPKLAEGDGQSPEGYYEVPPRMMNPNSRFHLAFNVGYPNAYDRDNGRTGSFLMVHGGCASVGCYAMTDDGIEEIYGLADAAHRGGQSAFPVHIFPFRMTEANLRRHASSRWIDFWRDLQKGYLLFEKEKRPPHIEVHGGRYEVTSGLAG